jgi:anaerobic magnesium-protoporphyrin IX monomethyl ester cyclase
MSAMKHSGAVDVLFTHAYHLAFDRKQLERQQPYPPLGTLYAAALARRQGFSVGLFDSMLEDPEQYFAAALEEYRPQVVVIYEDSFNYLSKMCLGRMREVAWQMQEEAGKRGIRVFIHGSDASDNAAVYLRRGFDAVLSGEGEQTLSELLIAVLRDKQFSGWDIPGLAYCHEAMREIVRTPPRHPMKAIDDLPFPARDLAPMERYGAIWKKAHGRRSTNIVTSRGCPFQCNWCAKPIYGNSFALRSAKSVAEEVELLQTKYGIEHLWFADDIFALDRHWMQEFAGLVEERGCALPYKVQSRASLMTPETVAALRRSGCEEVWMGAESGAQSVLDAMDKGQTVEHIAQAAQRLREAGIRACFFLQFGYPGEGWKEIEQTIELVRRARPYDIGVSVSYPLPNTVFYDRVKQQLGSKRNWVDSGDLSVLFQATYSNEFYRALRDALHAEVDSWREQPCTKFDMASLWRRVFDLEATCRNAAPTVLPVLCGGRA